MFGPLNNFYTSAIVYIIRVSSLLIGIVSIVIIDRFWGQGAVGRYQISIQFLNFTSIIALFGLQTLFLREAARLDHKSDRSKLANRCMKYIIILSISISTLLFLISEPVIRNIFKNQISIWMFYSIVFAIPFYSMMTFSAEYIRIEKDSIRSETMQSLIPKAVFIILLVMGLTTTLEMPNAPVLALSTSLILSGSVFSSWVLKDAGFLKDTLGSRFKPIVEKVEFLREALPIAQSNILMLLSGQALILILAFFTTPEEVATYGISLQFSALISFYSMSIMRIYAPKFSASDGTSPNRTQSLVRNSVRLNFFGSILIFGMFLFLIVPISSWLRGDYLGLKEVYMWLSASVLANVLTGPSGMLMDMFRMSRTRRNILIVTASVSLTLALLGIWHSGALGLAKSIFLATLLSNLLGAYVLYKVKGIICIIH